MTCHFRLGKNIHMANPLRTDIVDGRMNAFRLCGFPFLYPPVRIHGLNKMYGTYGIYGMA